MNLWIDGFPEKLKWKMGLMPVKGKCLDLLEMGQNAGLSLESSLPAVPMICRLPAHSQTLKALLQCLLFGACPSEKIKGEITESYFKSLE